MIKEINSLKNPRIKNLFQLKEKSKQRRAQGLFIIEGKREVLLAVNSGYTIKTIYFDPLLFDLQKLKQLENHQIEWVILGPDNPRLIPLIGLLSCFAICPILVELTHLQSFGITR